jgi:hypothetical protein
MNQVALVGNITRPFTLVQRSSFRHPANTRAFRSPDGQLARGSSRALPTSPDIQGAHPSARRSPGRRSDQSAQVGRHHPRCSPSARCIDRSCDGIGSGGGLSKAGKAGPGCGRGTANGHGMVTNAMEHGRTTRHGIVTGRGISPGRWHDSTRDDIGRQGVGRSHNPEVAGSNPAPATTNRRVIRSVE